MKDKKRIGVVVAGGLMCAFFIGCGQSATAQTQVFPVRGKVRFNGKATPGALVVLQPSSPSENGVRAVGYVQPNGSFNLKTFTKDDGAPAGRPT